MPCPYINVITSRPDAAMAGWTDVLWGSKVSITVNFSLPCIVIAYVHQFNSLLLSAVGVCNRCPLGVLATRKHGDYDNKVWRKEMCFWKKKRMDSRMQSHMLSLRVFSPVPNFSSRNVPYPGRRRVKDFLENMFSKKGINNNTIWSSVNRVHFKP